MTLSKIGIRISSTVRGNIEKKRLKGSIKWSDLYSSEVALEDAIRSISVYESYSYPYRGYEYIHTFNKQLQYKEHLSEAQMRMAKKLASEIFIAVAVSPACCWR